MKILYRFSDSKNNKQRPKWFDKRKIMEHFIHRFHLPGNEIFLFADNISKESLGFLFELWDKYGLQKDHIIKTTLGNSQSFLYVCQFAVKMFKNADEIIYIAEDDYVYLPNASQILTEGITYLNADYVTGYDHPDKYMGSNDPYKNPQIISDGGEITCVAMTPSSHWKYTNSTTMTFVSKLRTLKEDYSVFLKYCQADIPYDYQMFCELIRTKKRKIASCIPAVSTHCEKEHLSPLINWEKELI